MATDAPLVTSRRQVQADSTLPSTGTPHTATPGTPPHAPSLAERAGERPATRGPSTDLTLRPRGAIALATLDRQGRAATTDAATATAPADIRLANTLPEFQRRLDAQKVRPVNLDEAAAVINAVRHQPLADPGGATRHRDLAARVTPEMMARWNTALGLTPAQQAAMNDAAAKGGRWIPTSGSLFQAALYGAIPFAALRTSPTNVLYASLAALVVQPFVTAGLQTPIVSAITLMRQKAAPMVKMPGNLKAKETLPEIEAALKALQVDAVRDAQAMRTLIQRLAARHAEAGLPDDAETTPAHIEAFLARLDPAERAELETLQQAQTDRAVRAGHLVMDTYRLEGMQDRQFRSTATQAPWRIFRAMSGIFAPALQKAGAPAGWITATSVVLAFGALAGQHHGAGVDEKTAQADEHQLGLLYGDLFNAQGRADWEAGRPVTAAGIDEAKFRNLIIEPETAIAGRVAVHLARHRDDLQAKLDALGTHAANDSDAEEGRPDVETLRHEIAECDHDIGRLNELDVAGTTPDGFARQLLDEVMKDTSVAFSWREGSAKLMAPLEYSAQLGQRFAQQFTLGPFGGAGAVALTRGVGAAVGGTSRLAAGAEVALSLGAGVLGAFAALTQYTAVNVKNARRDRQGEDTGFFAQVAHGIGGPVWQRHATRSGQGARAAGEAAMDHDWRAAGPLRAALAHGAQATDEATDTGDVGSEPRPGPTA